MPPELGLVSQSHAALVAGLPTRTQWWQSITVGGVISLAMLLAGLPLVSIALMSIVGASAIAALAASTRPPASIAPESIASVEARQTYRAIVDACDDVERVIDESPSAPSSARIRERCRTAVELCGRVAYLANPLQRYLDRHNPHALQGELDRLRARTEITTDERTVVALSRATAARAHQLETYNEMCAIQERIQARLELVLASLESFAALLVKLHVVESEQLALAGETFADRVDEIGQDLDVLEAALAMKSD